MWSHVAVMSFLVICSTAYNICNPCTHGASNLHTIGLSMVGSVESGWLLLKGNTESLQAQQKPQGCHFRGRSEAKSEVYFPVSHPRSGLKEASVLPERGATKESYPGHRSVPGASGQFHSTSTCWQNVPMSRTQI